MLEVMGIRKPHNEYPDKSTQEFLSLDDYLIGAKRIIKKCISLKKVSGWNKMKQHLEDEDFISHIAHAMMIADWRYDVNRGMSRKNHRFNYALYTIRAILYQDKKNKNSKYQTKYLKSLDISIKDFDNLYSQIKDERAINPLDNLIIKLGGKLSEVDQISECLTNGILTKRESEAIRLYYIEDMTLEAAGNQLGITRERIRQLVNSGVSKIKETLNV